MLADHRPSHTSVTPPSRASTVLIGGGPSTRLQEFHVAEYRSTSTGDSVDSRPRLCIEEMSLPTINTKDGTQIFYKDWGTGQPVVFSHGWPLTADAWDDQMVFLGSHGY